MRKTFQFLHKKFSLECKISSNPVERVYWYKDGVALSNHAHHHQHHDKLEQTQFVTENNNIRVDRYDVSNINDYYKILLTLTVLSAAKEDFGEYQCCAINSYGQICSNIFVQEIKSDQKLNKHHTTNSIATSSSSLISKLASPSNKDTPNIINSDEGVFEEAADAKSEYSEDEEAESSSGSNAISNSLDSKDKRRHYLLKSKQFLHLESQAASSSTSTHLSSVCLIAFSLLLKYC